MTAATWSAVFVGAAVLMWPRSGVPSARLTRRRPVRATGPTEPPARVAPPRRSRSTSATSGTSATPERGLVVLLEGLAATLRAGLTPARALRHLAATSQAGASAATDDLVSRLAREAATGSPLEPVWRGEARVRGSPDLLAVAEGWALSERHGAPLVDVLDVVAGGLRDRSRTDAAIEAALAAPRATARLLGVLPFGGLALGELVGVHPLAVLVGTGAGRVVGCAGLLCTYAGRVWMRRLVAAVTKASAG